MLRYHHSSSFTMAYLSALLLAVCISCVFCQTQKGCLPPMIIEEPDQVIYYADGQQLTLPCLATGNPRPTFKWKRNGQDFRFAKDDPRVYQASDNGTLVFNRIQSRDAGTFQCQVRNKYGVAISVDVQVIEAVLQDFQADVQTHNPRLGEPFSLTCALPLSVPKASIMWVIRDRDGGFSNAEKNGRVMMDNDNKLWFSNVISEDEHDLPYACMAVNSVLKTNTIGSDNYIRIAQDPTDDYPLRLLYSSPADIKVVKKQTVSIKCIFGGNPTPSVQWSRTDNQPMSNRVEVRFDELTIEDIEHEDAGRYQCVGRNSLSERTITKTFIVRVQTLPMFLVKPTSVVTGKGGLAQFHCKADGLPRPVLRWYINGQMLSDSVARKYYIRRMDANTIQMDRLRADDNLVVRCNASNEHGYKVARATLCVSGDAPEIVEAPKIKTTVRLGHSANLTCRVASKQPNHVGWLKDGNRVIGSRFNVLANGTLHIKPIKEEDAGKYQCMVRTSQLRATSREGELIVCQGNDCPSGSLKVTPRHIVIGAMAFILLLGFFV